jgi:hypothetical protein
MRHARPETTVLTRIPEADFWVLPVGAPIQLQPGQPVYMDDRGGLWLLQIAPDGSLYRVAYG